MLSTDFSHGWSSPRTNRFYRVEISLNIGSEYVYVFSIDGLPFSQMPDKSMVRARSLAKADNNSRYGSSDFQTSSTTPAPSTNAATRRASLGAASGTSNNTSNNRLSAPRGTFQSPAGGKTIGGDGTFDPFESTNEPAAFDPFASEPASKPSRAQPSRQSAAAVDLFDSSPGPTNTREAVTTASTAATISHSHAAITFDAFSDAPGQSSDPFSSPAPAASAKPAASAVDFDPFGSTPSPPNKPVAAAFPPPKAPATSAATALFQSFDEPLPGQDLFGGSSVQTGTIKPPARRSSAQEISMDFAGLAFGPAPSMPPMQVQQPPVSTSTSMATSAPTVASPEAFAREADKPSNDPWAHGSLVDLDLTGKSQAVKRNPSTSAGPSLNTMLGVTTSQPASRRSSVQGGAQLTPADLLNSMNDPFGAPALLSATQPGPAPIGMNVGGGGMVPANRPVMSPALAISSLGNPMSGAPPMMASGYGAPPRGPALAPSTLGGPMPMGGMGGGIGGGMAAAPGGMMGGPRPQHRASIGGPMGGGAMGGGMSAMGNRSGYTSGISMPSSTQAPKSSLDSLDWKA